MDENEALPKVDVGALHAKPQMLSESDGYINPCMGAWLHGVRGLKERVKNFSLHSEMKTEDERKIVVSITETG
jgi:hypothetical protein